MFTYSFSLASIVLLFIILQFNFFSIEMILGRRNIAWMNTGKVATRAPFPIAALHVSYKSTITPDPPSREDGWSADSTLETDLETSVVAAESADKPDDDSKLLQAILSSIDELPTDADHDRSLQASIEMFVVQRSPPQNHGNYVTDDEFKHMTEAQPGIYETQEQPGISTTQTQAGNVSMEPQQDQSRLSINFEKRGLSMIESEHNQGRSNFTFLKNKLLGELEASFISDFTWESGSPRRCRRNTTVSADFEAMGDLQTSTNFNIDSNHHHLGPDGNVSKTSQQTTEDTIDDPGKHQNNPVTGNVEEMADLPIQTHDRLFESLYQPVLYQMVSDNYVVGSNLTSLKTEILAVIEEAFCYEVPCGINPTTQRNNLQSADCDALEEPQAQSQPELSKALKQPGPNQVESEDQPGPEESHMKRRDSTELRLHQAIIESLAPSCKNSLTPGQEKRKFAYSTVIQDLHRRQKSISYTSSQNKETGKQLVEQQQPYVLKQRNFTTAALVHCSMNENSEEPNTLNPHDCNVNGTSQRGSQANPENLQSTDEITVEDELDVNKLQHKDYEQDKENNEEALAMHGRESTENETTLNSTKNKRDRSRWKRMRGIFSGMKKMNYGFPKKSRSFSVKSKSRSFDVAEGEAYVGENKEDYSKTDNMECDKEPIGRRNRYWTMLGKL